eukprot:986723-Pyramimonas_sp.AAC.2
MTRRRYDEAEAESLPNTFSIFSTDMLARAPDCGHQPSSMTNELMTFSCRLSAEYLDHLLLRIMACKEHARWQAAKSPAQQRYSAEVRALSWLCHSVTKGARCSRRPWQRPSLRLPEPCRQE